MVKPDVKETTILLVEDESLIAMDEAAVLERNGYKVVTAYNAKKAIEKARDESIDLVLMDIDLGDGKMDGTEAAEEILKHREVPVVFLTSHAEKEMVEMVKGITRYGYVLKNAGEFVLIESISMAFELFEAYQKEKEATARLEKELEKNRKIREDLEESKIFLDSIIDQSPLPTWISDEKGVLIRLNDASRELFGVTDDAGVVGRYDYHKDEEVIENGLVSQFDEVYTQGKTLHFTIDYDYSRVEHVDVPQATHRYLECTIFPIKNSKGKVTNAVFQQKDITKQKEEEDQLLLFRQAVDSSKDLIVAVDSDFRYILANPAFLRRYELTEKEVIGKKMSEILDERLLQDVLMPKLKRALEGEVLEFKLSREYPTGEQLDLKIEYYPLKKEGAIFGVVCIARELELSQERMEIILNSIPEDIYIVDTDTYEILFMNEQMNRSFPQAKVGDICYEVFRGETSPCSHCTNPRLIEQNQRDDNTITWEGYNPINGEWYLNYDKLIPWEEGKQVRMQIAANITDRKQYEEELKTLNKQKDILMGELNHRVKNNLLMVSSLVGLKNAEVGDQVDLSDLQNQIDAIQLIHEKLNQSEEVSTINAKDYIEDLVYSLFSQLSEGHINTILKVEEIILPTKLCVSLGLIINEIATNAIKHGSTEKGEAEFTVTLSKDEEAEEHLLIMSNNGKPFPEDIGFQNPGSSGLRLVSALVEQIGGTIQLQRKPHPVFTLRFPLKGL